MIDEAMKQYWDESHDKRYLAAISGHSLSFHMEFLDFELHTRGNILCIGVGTGSWIREIQAQTEAEITVLDVCEKAVRDFPGIIDPSLLPENYFDLAISFWVAPHMTLPSLEQQIKYVIRSLKPTGLFALQYIEPVDETAIKPNEVWIAKAGRMAYSWRTIEKIVMANGGTYRTVRQEPTALKTNSVAAHIRRQV